MTTKADLEKKLNSVKNSSTLLWFGIIVGVVGIMQALGMIDDLRILIRLSGGIRQSEALKLGDYTTGTGGLIMIFSFLLCLISQFGSAIALYKAIRGK